jgi:MurNAc alpha-1-phosphate uridylyltransferase
MTIPESAMVLAAGLGLRMRPITERIPKPLVRVAERTLLDRALDHLEAVGVARAVVNAHYRAEQIVEHLKVRTRPKVELSIEDDLLETGGGVARALPKLGETFYVVNSDIMWLDGKVPALVRLARAWDPARMDALLLMQRTASAVGYEGIGDYVLDPLGLPRRRKEREVAPFLFAGVQILHRRLFEGAPEGKFSLNLLYDKAEKAKRLHAIVHDGEWYHVGTPEALGATERLLALGRIDF